MITSDLVSTGVSAAIVTSIATPVAIAGARRLDVLDRPRGYKAHAQPTPLLGGVAVVMGLVAGVGVAVLQGSIAMEPALVAVSVGIFLIVAAGVIDDLNGLAVREKLAWQVAATALSGLILVLLGVRLELFLGGHTLLAAMLTVAWVVAITNAFNLLDNMNGLCAGLGAVASIAFAVYGARAGASTTAVVAAGLAGACLGFLPYNWPRARIFLGDTGSMAIGFTLAAISVMGVYTSTARMPAIAILAPVIVLALPIADVIVVFVLRLASGHPPWVGDRRHVSHRLVRRGVPPWLAVAILWIVMACCGAIAMLLPAVDAQGAVWLLGAAVGIIGLTMVAAGTRGLG